MSGVLAGKVAIVTGAGQGIGRGCAEALAAAGAAVVVAEVNPTTGQEAVKAIQDAGGRAWLRRTDVTNPDDVDGLIHQTLDQWDRLDILVNNVGTHIPGTILETTEEQWDFLLTLNLKSVYLCCRAALPALLRTKGCIINISSMTGLVGQRDGAAYTASKGGIIALTKAIALDHAAGGVRVNCICPGNVDTPLMQAWIARQRDPEAVRTRVMTSQPVGRLADPQEIGRVAVFLASDAASFMTGVALPVDGGATLGY